MRVIELGVGVDYHEALALQRRLHERVADGDEGTVLLLEHASVYTAGTSTRQEDLPTNGEEAVRVDRGGRITWHGPGQLVGYPIVAPGVPPADWVRLLEEAIVRALAEHGVEAGRVAGRAGVWIVGDGADRKIAQVGVRLQRGVSLHGVAINVACSLAPFDAIVPCGISDAGVTTLAAEGVDASPAEVGRAFALHLAALLDEPLVAADVAEPNVPAGAAVAGARA